MKEKRCGQEDGSFIVLEYAAPRLHLILTLLFIYYPIQLMMIGVLGFDTRINQGYFDFLENPSSFYLKVLKLASPIKPHPQIVDYSFHWGQQVRDNEAFNPGNHGLQFPSILPD